MPMLQSPHPDNRFATPLISLARQLIRPGPRCLALGCLVLLLTLLYLRFVYLAPVDHDEVEHAHVGFKMTQGFMPYRDFYQNHTPAYWLVTMLTVTAAPFSINAVMLGRAVSILALVGCWLAGLHLLAQNPWGRTWLTRLVYTLAMLALAFSVEFHEARPDPVMTLLASTALCLYPARGTPSSRRTLLLGLLAGLAVVVSLKALPLTLIVPMLLLTRALLGGYPWLAPLLTYCSGGFLALFPVVLWLVSNELVPAFWFDVIALNQAMTKPWYNSFIFLQLPVFPLAGLGALVWLLSSRNRPQTTTREAANGPLLLTLWIAAILPLALFTRHNGLYNMQLFTVPMAVGTACLTAQLLVRIRGSGFRLLLLGALLAYPTLCLASPLTRLKANNGIPQNQLEQIIDLARQGSRTCTAFSPWHPIFCLDVSGLSNGWDLFFPQTISDPEQLNRFDVLWSRGVHNTVAERPDIIVRHTAFDPWQGALQAGLLTPAELAALDTLAPEYATLHLGPAEIWHRPDGEDDRSNRKDPTQRDAASQEPLCRPLQRLTERQVP